MKARPALILPVFLLALAPAGAVPLPNGPALKVSNCDACSKRTPAVAGTATGSSAGAFVTTWESATATDTQGISGRFFTKAAAPRGGDVLVSKNKQPAQHDPAVATDAQGNSVVAWSEVNGTNSDIVLQRYKATGAPAGAAVVVNVDEPQLPMKPLDVEPSVAVAPNGSFVVAWVRSVPPSGTSEGSPPAVMVRRYSAAGAPLGAPRQVNTGLALGSRPDVCIDSTGRPVVAWPNADEFRPFEPSKTGVSLRRLSAAGATLGPEIVVAQPLSTKSTAVSVACGAGGSFVVVWSTDQAPAVERVDIVAQRFTTQAQRNGPVFRINNTTTGDQTLPAAVSDAAGNFVVVWQSLGFGNPTADAVVGRRFLASGTADGTDFVVHARASSLEARPVNPDVGNLGAKGFVVVWSQGTSGLQAQRYKLTPKG